MLWLMIRPVFVFTEAADVRPIESPIESPCGSKIDKELVEQWAELISIKRVADVYGHSLMNASRAIFSPKTVEINNA